jgi:hypothetical protein
LTTSEALASSRSRFAGILISWAASGRTPNNTGIATFHLLTDLL